MKKELSGLDVYFLVQELQSLVNARFQRAYARDKEKELFLQLHNSTMGKVLLRVSLPGLMYIATSRPEFPQIPPGFVTFLRKRLSRLKVVEISQLGMDRVIQIIFSNKEGDLDKTFKLIVELITPGNIILAGRKPIKGGKLSEELILSLQTPQNYKDRTVRGGIPYEAPTPVIDVKTEDEAILVEKLVASDMESLVKGLATGLSLGGAYAEELCERAGLEKNAKITKKDATKAVQELKKLLGEERKISESLDEVHSSYDEVVQAKPRKQKGSIAEQQAQQRKGLEEKAEQNQRKGELIYENYAEIKTLLEKIKKGEDPEHALIKKIDRKTGTVTLEL